MKRRLLAVFMVLALLVGLMPMGALADNGDPETATSSVNHTENNVTVNKSVSGNQEEGYTLKLEAYASNKITMVQGESKPLDIVLVLDTSGSMDDNFGEGDYVYNPVVHRQNWKVNQLIDDDDFWPYRDTVQTSYYTQVGDDYYQVYVQRTQNGYGQGHEYTYQAGYYDSSNSWEPLGDSVRWNSNDNIYTGTLYRQSYSSTSKLDAMKSAVNGFIDSVLDQNSSNQISIVSFDSSASTEQGLTSSEDTLKRAVNGLQPGGSTYSDEGLDVAQDILENVQRDSKKVVVLFTDGVPGYSSSWDYTSNHTASNAVNIARDMKDAGVTIYTVGIFENANPSADPTQNRTSDANKYMQAVSSNYPNAEVTNRWGNIKDWDDLKLGTGNYRAGYYLSADNPEGLEQVFEGLASSVEQSTLEVYPDTEAVLTDTLSEYFNFPADLLTSDVSVDTSKVNVYTVDALSVNADGEVIRWSDTHDNAGNVSVTIKEDTINITGFDYVGKAVTVDADNKVSGCKLVVEFPIELDESAITASGVYETNDTDSSKAGLEYKASEESCDNDESTLLDESPSVNITVADPLNGTAVTIEVYVDGQKVTTNPVTVGETTGVLSLSRTSGTYDDYDISVSDGTITFDFNINPQEQYQNDCVDIIISDIDNKYVLDSIEYYQYRVSSSPNDVVPGTGSYTVDNLAHDATEGSDGVDMKIYLSSKYTVEYYVNEQPYTPTTADSNIYVDNRHEGQDEGAPDAAGEYSNRFWQNDGLSTSFTLPTYTPATGQEFDGWYLGAMSNGDKLFGPQSITSTADAVDGSTDHVIKYYGATQATTGTLTVTKTVTGLEGSASLDSDFAITVTGPNSYNTSLTISDDTSTTVNEDSSITYTWTITGVPAGSYTATESNYTVDTYAHSGSMTDNETLAAGGTAKLELTNSYTKQYTVTVTVVNGSVTGDDLGDDTAEAEDTEIYVITVDAGATPSYTFSADTGYALDTVEVNDDVIGVNRDTFSTYTFNAIYSDQEIVVTYGEDKIGGDDPDEGDGIPDSHQATVTYKVVNGTFVEGTTTTELSYVVTTDTYSNGAWSSANKHIGDDECPIPTNMVPDSTHIDSGDWDNEPSSDTVLEGGETYTYTYTFDTEVSTGLKVEKTVVSVGGTAVAEGGVIPAASVGETIIYKIVVTNTGNVPLSGISVTDSLVDTLYSDAGCTTVATDASNFALTTDDAGKTRTFYAKYEVTATDAASGSVANTATASVPDGPSDSDEVTVSVTPQHTLTVNYYYNSISEANKFTPDGATLTYTLDEDASWSVVISPETVGTHVALATVTDDEGNHYVFDVALSDETLSGTIGATDVTVDLVYSLDNWKDDNEGDSETGGDGVPDYQQALINYVVAEGQEDYSSVSPTIQVETLTDDDNGTYTGQVTASSTATAVEGYAFDYWTEPGSQTSWNATLSDTFTATGGEEYTYTAHFSEDKKGGGDDGDKPDEIPDKYQVFVYFEARENGSVSGDTFQVFTLRDANENPTQTGTITPATVTPVPDDNYEFRIWTEGSGDTSIDPFAERTVQGNTTITFYAHFRGTNEAYTLDKALTEVDGAAVPEGYKARVGDELTYTITVTNTGNTVLEDLTLTDTFNGAGTIDFGTIAEGYSVTTGADGDTTITIESLAVGGRITITCTYTVVAGDIGSDLVNAIPDGEGDEPDAEVTVEMDDYTVEIAPADMVIYTGGEPYGGITDANGNIITETTNGLPEPGYHVVLSDAVMEWLNIETGEAGARDLTNYLSFRYSQDDTNREWRLEYMGVYSTNPLRYVYRMYPTAAANPEVRIEYTDAAGTHYFDDDITMDENTVYAEYTMSIYSGGLDQNAVEAVLTVGGESIVADVTVTTGTLTIRSTTNDEYVNDLGTGTADVSANDGITALHSNGNIYYVNDTRVTLDTGRVQLLVDEVSNSAAYNAAMGSDAVSYVEDVLNVSLRDAGYEPRYMDLVDNANGNTVVNMDGTLTIYWPVPDDAEGDEFYVVHYTDMNRSSLTDADELDAAAKDIITGVDVVRIDGQEYVTFTTTGFSPFALIYETDDGRRPGPRPDDEEEVDEPDRDYEPKWLNTEDHFAYIVGYEDGEVKPNNDITRAEVATIFFRLLTDEARADFWSQENGYSDVAASDWFNNAVSTLSNAGIINGYEDGTFRPNAPITRAEFTAIATRFFDYTAEYEGAFNDVYDSNWYADYVQAAVDMGLVDGYPDGGFHPESNITRAEAVTIVNRVLGRVPHEDHLLDEDEMNVWPDNLYGAWYYADMQEATNSHDYNWIRVDRETVERWTDKLPERDWEALEKEWSSAYSG